MRKAPKLQTRQSARVKNESTSSIPDRTASAISDTKPIGGWSHLAKVASNDYVLAGLFLDLCSMERPGENLDHVATNFVMGFADAMKPRDAAEALLLTQMAATHRVTIMLTRRLSLAKTIPQQDSAERALNKCARTFAAQMETLKRYRSKGQQTVRVERVTIQEGGQAIVGNVEAGGRGNAE